MGKLKDSALWSLLNPKPVGSLVNVGAMAATPKHVTATLIAKVGGLWVYGDEAPIEVWPNRFLEIPYGADGERLAWIGLEIKTEDRSLNRKHLAFTMEPYSLDWYGHAPFRPAAKTKTAAASLIAKAAAAYGGDLAKAIDSIAYDPFETDRDWFTARLKNPMRLRWDGLQPLGDQFLYGRSKNYTFATKSANWLFGVCPDFATAVEEVKREITGSSIAATLALEPAELFDATLHTAVQQALAGRFGAGQKPQRPAHKAALIHRKHMEAAAKRSGASPR